MPESFGWVYVPLGLLVESSETLERAAEWYIELWR
jgi:hypothetical protein